MRAIQQAGSGQGNLIPVTGQYLLDNLEILGSQGIPMYRVLKNAEGDLRAEPFPPAKVEALSDIDRAQKQFLVEKDWKKRLFEESDTFDAQLEPLLENTPEERAHAVRELKTAIIELKAKNLDPLVKAKAIMDLVSRAFLLNKASLRLRPSDVTVSEKAVAKDTESIIGTALEMAEEPELMASLFEGFRGLSNGQTINHILRVFTSYTGYLTYYNRLHRNRLAANLRKIFPELYRATYRRILPKLEDHLMTSDQLLQLSYMEPADLKEFALGAFLHDLGKMGNIDYFESDAGYDAQQIQQHVFLSAGLILMNYGADHEEARLLAGDHHNALGHPGGYGVTRMEREKGLRPAQDPVRVLSDRAAGFISGQSLGYLPVEMLAVVDVYDAMTDASRIYKKPMTPGEAAAFLEDTMAKQGKLDPVLVDIYIDFVRSQGAPIPENRGLAYKLSLAG